MDSPVKFKTPVVRSRGETLVWLSSAGLALGIIMVIALLGLIFIQGITVFWPKSITEVVLSKTSDFRINNSDILAGHIVKKQQNRKRDVEEWQLFIGNKNAYKTPFTYIDTQDIESSSLPEDIMVAERLEYGKAIFYPEQLILESGNTINANDPSFIETLNRKILEVNQRRKKIRTLEKDEIGKINRKVSDLRFERRSLERKISEGEYVDPQTIVQIDQQLSTIEAAYRVLAEEARTLRALQEVDRLEYRLPTGSTLEQPLGDFVEFYQPNSMSIFQKLGFFFHQIWSFLTDNPREANTEGGIFPAIFGTFVMTVLMSAAVVPFGVIAAIYLREYANQGNFVRGVRIAVNNLAGVPSIVFGVFGLGFFVYFIGGSIDNLFYRDRLPTATFGTGGVLWASLTLALMTVPVVIVATEEALAAVPRGIREASLACGASKWQTIQKIILPASAPGILTGLILAMARGAGEVAPLMLVGVVKLAPALPIDGIAPFIHLERKFMHLGFHIYDLGFQSPDSEAARPMVFATTFLLILLVVILNLGAVIIRNNLQKKYKTNTF